MPLESQAAFGRRQGISKQRVGQLVRAGKIDGPALVAQTGKTLIDSEIAEQQLRRRLDPGQRLGQRDAIRSRGVRRPAPSPPAFEQPSPALAAMLAVVPAGVAWSAISLGIEPWKAHALFEMTALDLIGEGQLRFGVEVDKKAIEAVDWPILLGCYHVIARGNEKAWRAARVRHEADRDARLDAAEQEIG